MIKMMKSIFRKRPLIACLKITQSQILITNKKKILFLLILKAIILIIIKINQKQKVN